MASTYYANLSVFPVLPIHRLLETSLRQTTYLQG